MINSIPDINAYILTGGQSRRMNTDKSRIKLNGKTLTEITYHKLKLLFKEVFIVGKENHLPTLNFIQDIKPIQCPLNGIVTSLDHSQNDWIFIIACDLPMVRKESIDYLYNNIKSNIQIVLPIVGDDLQPLCAFYNKSVLKVYNEAITKSEYSIMKLMNQFEVAKVTISSENKDEFLNVNNPEELRKVESLLMKRNN